jgi:DNA-directed RNA polymerase specialized sigma24 family protein
LRIAPGSVRTRLHRARAALRERLGEDGGNRA